MGLKCFKVSAWLTGIISVLFIGLGIAMPFIFQAILHNSIKNQVVMTPNNYNIWGEIPGDTNSLVIRNYTFYNFTNPWEVFFNNATPIFVELGPYSYQEVTIFMNTSYLNDEKLVNFNMWRYYLPINGTTGQEEVSVLNYGPLAAWYQLKQANESLIAQQVLSLMLMSISDIMRYLLYSYGANAEFMTLDAAQILWQEANITESQANSLWNDPLFGWKNKSTLPIWMDFGQNGQYSGAGKILADYFKLNYKQMSIFYNGIFNQCVQLVNQSAIVNHYCKEMNPNLTCDDKLLATMQLVQQQVSLNTPKPVTPFQSITSINSTTIGYPEISFWYNSQFLNNSPVAYLYQNIEFPVTWGLKVFNFTRNPKNFVREPFNLFNSWNMDYFWYNGKEYDKDPIKNAVNLTNIQNRFLLNDTKQAYVFWEYMKYFVYNFSLQFQNNGNQAMAGLGMFVSEKLYEGWTKVYDYLLPTIEGELIFRNISLNYYNCIQYFINTITNITQQQAETACSLNQISEWNINSMIFLSTICSSQSDTEFIQFYKDSTWTNNQIGQLCDPEGNSFFTVRDFYGKWLHKHYECSNIGIYCSKYEITLKQWANSTITQNPPTQLLQFYQPSFSVRNWNKDLTPIPWEFHSFAVEFQHLWSKPIQILSWDQSYDLLNFQSLFSETIIQRIFIYEQNNNQTGIKECFYFSDMKQLTYYLRYLMIGYSFGGFVQKRTINELLFGYIDPFVDKLKVKNPELGGNPSLTSCLMLNEPNTTAPGQDQKACGLYTYNYNNFSQQIYTGSDDNLNKLRYYSQIWNKSYITYNYSWFNGQYVQMDTITPWEIQVPLNGTDSAMNPPFIKENNDLLVFITTFYRNGVGKFTGQKPIFDDIETYQYKIGQEFYNNLTLTPINAIYYNDKYNGFMNMTSIQLAPVFVSKTHMLDADEFLQNAVIYKNIQNQIITANQWDDSWLDVEPNTGVCIQAVVNAQANLLFENDSLFLINSTKMMPIVNIMRAGNQSESTMNDYFGPLKLALKFKIWIILFPYFIALIILIICIILVIKYKKNKNKLQLPLEQSEKFDQSLIENKQNIQ